MLRVADYIMAKIEQEKVGHVFYVPGGQCVYLTDALRRNDNLKGIAVHHEQSAAMAALSYSLYSGNLGACLVTTGCAGTNTMTGLLHAWQDSIPCVFVSGQQNVDQTIISSGLPLRQVGVQEANIVELVTPITKYAHMLDRVEDVCYHVEKAIYMAKEGRQGPVWLDVPLNIQNAMIDEEQLKHFVPEPATLQESSSEDLAYVKSCLQEAKRPVVLAGQGIRSAKAGALLNELALKYRIPIVFTRFSVDLMDWRNEMNFGVVGAAGANREANFIIQNSDLVLSIGCRLSIDTTGPQRGDFAREAKILVVDIDAIEHAKQGVKIDRFILSDAGMFMKQLLETELEHTQEDWIEKCKHWKALFKQDYQGEEDKLINLKYFIRKLSDKFPENTVVVSDAGTTGCATPANCYFKASDRSIHPFAQGEMGFALPGAVGVACLCEGMSVVITGDGSFMMNLQELQTVVRNQFNIKIVIINNNGYSGVRHGQKAHFRGKTIGTDPSNGLDFPDYGKIAAAFGLPYVKIDNVADIDKGIDEVLNVEGPCMCEVFCDPDQFDLHNALVMYGKRKFGFRPIEDQSPFLDRNVFFEEMIVEPMETSYGKPM